MTKFAACFILVFGELAFGGMFALAIPPFFKIERGFYKSSGGVYLGSGIVTMVGLAMLAARGPHPDEPGAFALWSAAALWLGFSIAGGLYVVTLWTDSGKLRARAYTATLLVGLAAVIATVMLLKPADFGALAAAAYAVTAITSALMLGLVSAAMMFGHWYLIDPNLPVEYLRSLVRMLAAALIADLAALMLALGVLALAGGAAQSAVATLIDTHAMLLVARLILGPVATLVLTWMTWQTLKVPQTMAATGLLYIALMAAIVGEMLGRFILFRTAVPL
ncbi:MAG TPA: hypothetical protein VNF27_12850 [Candidatus Binataceae bacterium]|nr:hypothetical protein [Candidatus Binataceae bacterium]